VHMQHGDLISQLLGRKQSRLITAREIIRFSTYFNANGILMFALEWDASYCSCMYYVRNKMCASYISEVVTYGNRFMFVIYAGCIYMDQ
jgi:hypothetical protein